MRRLRCRRKDGIGLSFISEKAHSLESLRFCDLIKLRHDTFVKIRLCNK